MINDDNKDTLAESWLRSLKNRPTVAVLLPVVIVITGIASFTDSIDKIIKFFVEHSNKLGDAKKGGSRRSARTTDPWHLDMQCKTTNTHWIYGQRYTKHIFI